MESTGRLSRHRRRSRTSPGARAAGGLVAVELVDDVVELVDEVSDVVDDVAEVALVVLVVVPGSLDSSSAGTNDGVGFDEVPKPLLLRALTFAVYVTPFVSPWTVMGLAAPSARSSVSCPFMKTLTR